LQNCSEEDRKNLSNNLSRKNLKGIFKRKYREKKPKPHLISKSKNSMTKRKNLIKRSILSSKKPRSLLQMENKNRLVSILLRQLE
jgi:hypothetical protein